MGFFQRFNLLCDEKGISPSGAAEEIGIRKSNVTAWKNEGRPSYEALKLTANYFKITTDFLLEETSIHQCPGCGLTYDLNRLNDVVNHERNHYKWETAVLKFGPIDPNKDFFNEEFNNRHIIQSSDHNDDDKYNAIIELFKILFCKNLLDVDYDLNHPDFDTYVSYLINQDRWMQYITKYTSFEVWQKLLNNYGVVKGIHVEAYYNSLFEMNLNAKYAGLKLQNNRDAFLEDQVYINIIPVFNMADGAKNILSNENMYSHEFENIKNPKEYFYLLVIGDQLINAGIKHESKVLFHKQTEAENGDIVACIINDEEITIRRYLIKDNSVVLISENSFYDPLIFSINDINEKQLIIGIAKKVIIDL